MRYLTIFKSVEQAGPPSPEEQAAMGRLIGEMASKGVLVTAEGCKGTDRAFRLRRTGGKVTRTDGPFAEAKEVIGGFAILNVASREEAIEWTRRFLEVAGDGESEVRELYDEAAYDGKG